MEFTIKTDGKPHLDALLKSDKKKAMEVIGTFVELMEEACNADNAIAWVDLPEKFSKDLSFKELVKGILHGSLDLKDITPDAYDAVKEEVHPLSMLSPRKNYLDGGIRYSDWRQHYRLPADAGVNQETVAAIFRKLLRYYRYVNIDALAGALINKQVKTFEGLGERNVKTLPFIPALRYQQAHFGDLHVGKFFDSVGFLDCGTWVDGESRECPACQRKDILKLGKYHYCEACNAGYREESL
jgi:hypothetical protein